MLRIIRKFRIILNRKQKIKVIFIVIMMIIGALLETLGVGLVLPLIKTIMNPSIIEDNFFIKQICIKLGFHTSVTFILFVLLTMIGVYLFKNIYLFMEYYIQNHFVYNTCFEVQRGLINRYLYKPYEYYLHADSGEIIKVLDSDTRETFILLRTVLTFFTEAVVSLALIAAIVITDPFMTLLFIGIMGSVMLIISRIITPILKRAGFEFQKNKASMYKWLLQSIAGIKEVKVTGKETFFREQCSKYGKKTTDAEMIKNVMETIPRLAIESAAISAMLGSIVILILMGREISTVIPQLGAFALIAIRLLPSINRMSATYNYMAFLEPMLDIVVENISTVNTWKNTEYDAYPKKMQEINALNKNIVLSDITYLYPNTEEPVLSNADMEIPVGSAVGIVGSSGAGKTTVVDILLGLLYPQSGQVLADGADIQKMHQEWLSHVGYIPQDIYLLDGTICANIAFGISEQDVSQTQIERVLEEAQLAEFVERLPLGINTLIGERGVRLSGGQRQRIAIARALYTNPDILVFDEATSALDEETEAAVMKSIESLHGKKTMIIIAHRLGTISGCDIIYRVENGKIVKIPKSQIP